MKKFLKGFLTFIVVCGLIGVLIGYLLSRVPVMSLGSNAFLISVANEQYQQAYMLLSPEFQKNVDLEKFKDNVKISHLDQYKSVVWLKTDIYPQQQGGRVLGRITTKDNQQFLIQFEYVLVQGEKPTQKSWLINSISYPKDETDTGQAKTQIQPQH